MGVDAAAGRPSVLVVDDDSAIREALQLALGDRYDIVEASSGVEALRIVGTRPVDLMLLDLHMPVLDGFGVLEELRARDANVSVIVLTATNAARPAVMSMKLGAFDYITKPFDEDHLLGAIERALPQDM